MTNNTIKTNNKEKKLAEYIEVIRRVYGYTTDETLGKMSFSEIKSLSKKLARLEKEIDEIDAFVEEVKKREV